MNAGTTRLRSLGEDDLERVHSWRNDPDVTRHLGRLAMSREQVDDWFASLSPQNGDRAFAILVDDTFVGYGLLTDADPLNKKCEAGVIIGEKSYWGRGIGTLVVRELMRIAFHELGFHRVLAVASARNPASIRCFERVGFQREGILRDANLRESEYIDLVLLSLLEQEWRSTG